MPDDLKMNPWIRIWCSPRQTIREVVAYNPKHRFFALCVIYGLATLLPMAQSFSLIEVYPFFAIVVGCIVFSPIVGAVGFYVATALLYWTGKMVGGSASFVQVRCAVSWASVTNYVNLLFWMALIVYFQDQVFCDTFAQSPFSKGEVLLVGSIYFLQFALSIWSFVLLLHTLGEVQGFSAWKSLLNVVISFVVMVGVLWIVGMALMRA